MVNNIMYLTANVFRFNEMWLARETWASLSAITLDKHVLCVDCGCGCITYRTGVGEGKNRFVSAQLFVSLPGRPDSYPVRKSRR